ncbi:MAG: formylglycine-generating enzyme family protein [Victivallaceae bacterium]|nr:formylglycine-generating enzyme family protein [Victivallaceae bacterium]
MALIPCPECKKKMSNTIESCPSCGYKPTKKEKEELSGCANIAASGCAAGCLIIIVIFVIVFIVGLFTSDSKKTNTAEKDRTVVKQKVKPIQKKSTQPVLKQPSKAQSPKNTVKQKIKKIKIDNQPKITLVSAEIFIQGLSRYAQAFSYANDNNITIDEYFKENWQKSLDRYKKTYRLADKAIAKKELNSVATTMQVDNCNAIVKQLKNIAIIIANNNPQKLSRIQKAKFPSLKIHDTINITRKSGQVISGKIYEIKPKQVLVDMGYGVIIGVKRHEVPSDLIDEIWQDDTMAMAKKYYIEQLTTSNDMYAFCSWLNDKENKSSLPSKILSNMPSIGNAWIVPEINMKFVYISPGSFQMGSNSGNKDEKPVHLVTLNKPFWVGKYEVKQHEYQSIMHCNPSKFQESNNPVETVSWNDAVKFCQTLTNREHKAGRLPSGYEYRLLTEAEWEFVARGGSDSLNYKYSGSNNLNSIAWHKLNSGNKTHNVGTKYPNELGIYDMSGNVNEWCLDDYFHGSNILIDNYNGAPADGGYWGNGTTMSTCILRGGGWAGSADDCRSSCRNGLSLNATDDILGFRVCLAYTIKIPTTAERKKIQEAKEELRKKEKEIEIQIHNKKIMNERNRKEEKFGPPPVASIWSGSYNEVITFLKSVAKDPDSIKIYSSSKVFYNDTAGWIIQCDWGGKNSFGGMNRSINWFVINHGQVIKMKDADAYK